MMRGQVVGDTRIFASLAHTESNHEKKDSPEVSHPSYDIHRAHSVDGSLFSQSILQKDVSTATLSHENLRIMYQEMEKELLLSTYTFPKKPSSDGYYHVYVADPTKKSGRRAIKAKNIEKLKQKVYQHEKGLYGNARKTFKDVFEIVQQEKARYVKDPEKLISIKNSVSVRKSNYKRFFQDSILEKKYIDEISKEDIEAFCLTLLTEKNLKKKAFQDMRGILSSVFRFAYEQYWIHDNPYTRIDFRKYNDMLIRDTATTLRAHSSAEIDRMLEHLHGRQEKKPEYIPAYALELQILVGLRRGEVAPLQWTDIEDTHIHISKEQLSVKGTEECIIVSHTKTYVDRQFPITDDVSNFLTRLRAVHDTYYPDSPYLFPDYSNHTGVINNNVVYHLYSRMCKVLGIKISKEYTKGPHSFRRNGITKVCNATGGNIYLASMLYGNSPQSASKHYYTGINIKEAKEILEGSQKVTKG